MADVAKNGQVEEEEDVSIQNQCITHFIYCFFAIVRTNIYNLKTFGLWIKRVLSITAPKC